MPFPKYGLTECPMFRNAGYERLLADIVTNMCNTNEVYWSLILSGVVSTSCPYDLLYTIPNWAYQAGDMGFPMYMRSQNRALFFFV